MGVYGLLSHCLERREQCVEYVDLVEVAREKGGIEILVDFYSFEHTLLNSLWKSLAAVGNNPYIRLLGGEYSILDEYVTKLITDLQSLDIHLVMYVDGAKGSSKIGTEQKLDTWQYRHTQDMRKMRDILSVFYGHKQIEDLSHSTNVRPVLLEVQVFETLKKCKCEVVQCSSGEADFVIARNLQSRPRALAVLSNDSDFCVFNCSKFIPNELFDLQNDLQLGAAQYSTEKPVRLLAGVISSQKVVNLLDLRDHSELIELCIISGNDFTSKYVKRLKERVSMGHGLIGAVKWIHQYRNIENHPEVQKEMDSNHAFHNSVLRSRQFYTLMLPSDEADSKGLTTNLIDEGIQQGNLPPNLMAMHNNFYWHRMLLEDCNTGSPDCESALSDLRKFIYRMVLNRKETMVVEYGRTPYKDFDSGVVHAVREDRFLDINNVSKDRIFPNLRTFHRIMTHYEPHFNTEWYKRYGWNVGFKFYVLRYFLVLNCGYNLNISQAEYMPLLALALCKVNDKWYQSLRILPTIRCVTIGNWFQNVYRHAYYFLGKILHLSHEFPEPKNIFCGSVWTTFYMASMHEGVLRSRFGIEQNAITRINRDMKNILQEKRHMLKYLVDGIYNLDARF